MRHEVTGVVREGGRAVGVDYRSPEGAGRLLADLVVGCDGRRSVVRRSAELTSRRFEVPFDEWWFRVPTQHHLTGSLLPRFGRGRALIVLPREGYLQVAYLGLKGADAALRARGIEAFRADVSELLPEVADALASVASMEDVKHLDVRVDRLRRWSAPGVLCIGDAAHAMSPVGGVGINLAVQDAVAAARILAAPLRDGTIRTVAAGPLVRRVQRRRRWATVVIQALQRLLHAGLIAPVLEGRFAGPPEKLVRVVRRAPWLSVVPALAVGIGPRPERAPVWARRRPVAEPTLTKL